jgi:hypothetical protein
MLNLSVGDTVIDHSLNEYKVTKIGRKYFYIKALQTPKYGDGEFKVGLETKTTKKDYLGHCFKIYLAVGEEVEQLRHKIQYDSAVRKIQHCFSNNHDRFKHLSLEQLNQIIQIINQNESKENS